MEKLQPTLEQLDPKERLAIFKLYKDAVILAVSLQGAREAVWRVQREIEENTKWLNNNRDHLSTTTVEVAFLEKTLKSATPQSTQIKDSNQVLLYAMYGYDGIYVENGGDRDYVISITNPPEQEGHYDYKRQQYVNLDPGRADIILVAMRRALAQKEDEITRLKQEIPEKESALSILSGEDLSAKQLVARLETELKQTIDTLNEHELTLWAAISNHQFRLEKEDYTLLVNARFALYPKGTTLPNGERLTKYVTPLTKDGHIPLVDYDNPNNPIYRLLVYKDLYQKDLFLLRPLPGVGRISLVWYAMGGGQDIKGYLDSQGRFISPHQDER